VKKEIKNTRKSKIVLFLFKLISTYMNTFVASLKKFFKTVSRGFHRNSFQFRHPIFLNVTNILKPLSFEGSFHHRREKKICWWEIRRIGGVAYVHNSLFGQKCLHYQCGMGRGIMQQEPAALCSKLWPHPGNVIQQSSDNNVESSIDCLPFRHKFLFEYS
jgi:hypothetical protein